MAEEALPGAVAAEEDAVNHSSINPMKAMQLTRSFTPWLQSAGVFAGIWAALITPGIFSALGAAEQAKTFASPEQAVSAMSSAVKALDLTALREIFGPDLEQLENPDQVQATNELRNFAARLQEKTHLVQDSSTRYELEVGNNSWPFPIPIVLNDGRWFFDTDAGADELLNRRIGRNELLVLEVMRGYVDAQREYASTDRDGSQVLKYAQKLMSSPGKKDGLYWPTTLDGEVSPLGPFFARAQAEGYFTGSPVDKSKPQPFHGYLFKVLTEQGKHAPGGSYNYVINGNMIGGFALVAWPAEYGESGIMSFIVNQQGRVFQKDLGPHTAKLADKMKRYDPDPSWHVSAD